MSCTGLMKAVFELGNGFFHGKPLTNMLWIQYAKKDVRFNKYNPETYETRIYSFLYPDTAKKVGNLLKTGDYCFKCGNRNNCLKK
jgi:hypothetical protein